MKKIAFLLPFVVCACATNANLVRKVYSPKKGGTVSYLNKGASAVINARKRDAQAKMEEFCGGSPSILSESSESENTGAVVSGNAIINTSSEYVYVNFSCPES